MRDMLDTKFQRMVRHAGFDPVPEIDTAVRPRQPVFVSDDGLRVPAVMVTGLNYSRRINRRATLEKLQAARRGATATPAKSEAAGAGTPAASGVHQP